MLLFYYWKLTKNANSQIVYIKLVNIITERCKLFKVIWIFLVCFYISLKEYQVDGESEREREESQVSSSLLCKYLWDFFCLLHHRFIHFFLILFFWVRLWKFMLIKCKKKQTKPDSGQKNTAQKERESWKEYKAWRIQQVEH